jgi:NAD(P)-dependent dehydrogenase (short-subunit alcohol dehydrogenase family)
MAPEPIRRAIDLALEAAIVPSFSKVGSAVRRRTDGWAPPPPGALEGATVVVTGATSGLGAEIARGVAAAGASVVAVGRNAERGRAVAASIVEHGGDATFEACDLSDLDDVRRLAALLADRHAHLHALVHNAGALHAERAETPQGLERTWATMVVAPHLLTRLLADRTDRAIWMSSGGMYLQPVDLTDLGWERRSWDGTRAYAQAKRAQIDLVAEAAGRGEPPLAVAMHPGWADTPGVADSLPGFDRVMGPLLRSATEGADTAVWLCWQPADELEAGGFYFDRRPRGTVRWPGTRTSALDRVRLRGEVDRQAGLV